MINLNRYSNSIFSEIEKLKQFNLIKLLLFIFSGTTCIFSILFLGVGYYLVSKYSLELNLASYYLSLTNFIFRVVFLGIFFIITCIQSTKEYSNNVITNLILSGESEIKLLLSKLTVYTSLNFFILLIQSFLVLVIYLLLPDGDFTFDKAKPFIINFLYLLYVILISVVFSILLKATDIALILGIFYIVVVETLFINLMKFVNESMLKINWLNNILNLSPFSLISQLSNSNDRIDILLFIFYLIVWYLTILGLSLFLLRRRPIVSK